MDALSPASWIALALCAGAVLVATLVFGREAQLARRVIFQFLFTIALPVVILMAVPLWGLRQIADLPPPIWQALIAAMVIATGWLTSTIFAELARQRERQEKLRDYHKAIFAEVRETLAVLYSEGQADAQTDAILARMQSEPDFVPFIAHESHDRVFAALVEEIEVLPRQTIDAVVAYYSLMAAITALGEDLRSARFAALDADRRILIYRDYVDMRRRAYQFGSYTLKLIDAYSKGGASAADAVTASLNTPDAGQSGPSQGSG